MSKTNKTTKLATVTEGFFFSNGEEMFWGSNLREELGGVCIGVMTSRGLVSVRNDFTAVIPGDRVVLRKGAGKSWGASPWVMTGRA
jgi:hypothetical protein